MKKFYISLLLIFCLGTIVASSDVMQENVNQAEGDKVRYFLQALGSSEDDVDDLVEISEAFINASNFLENNLKYQSSRFFGGSKDVLLDSKIKIIPNTCEFCTPDSISILDAMVRSRDRNTFFDYFQNAPYKEVVTLLMVADYFLIDFPEMQEIFSILAQRVLRSLPDQKVLDMTDGNQFVKQKLIDQLLYLMPLVRRNDLKIYEKSYEHKKSENYRVDVIDETTGAFNLIAIKASKIEYAGTMGVNAQYDCINDFGRDYFYYYNEGLLHVYDIASHRSYTYEMNSFSANYNSLLLSDAGDLLLLTFDMRSLRAINLTTQELAYEIEGDFRGAFQLQVSSKSKTFLMAVLSDNDPVTGVEIRLFDLATGQNSNNYFLPFNAAVSVLGGISGVRFAYLNDEDSFTLHLLFPNDITTSIKVGYVSLEKEGIDRFQTSVAKIITFLQEKSNQQELISQEELLELRRRQELNIGLQQLNIR